MDETSIEVLRSFPKDKTKCQVPSILAKIDIGNHVHLQYYLCKLNAWGYLDEHKDSYSIADKGLDFLVSRPATVHKG